jgi:hypothetical protein
VFQKYIWFLFEIKSFNRRQYADKGIKKARFLNPLSNKALASPPPHGSRNVPSMRIDAHGTLEQPVSVVVMKVASFLLPTYRSSDLNN